MKCVSTVLESQTAAQSEDIPAHVISRRPFSLAAVSFYIKLSKMTKGKKATGKKVAPAPTLMKKQEAKKMVNPLRKGLRTLALGWTSSSKEISRASSNGPTPSGCSSKGPFPISSSKSLLPVTSLSRPQTSKQLLRCLSLPIATGQSQSQRKSKGYWPLMKIKVLAIGISPLRDHLSSEQGQYRHHLGGVNKAQLVVTAHDVEPTELVDFLPALYHRVLYCIIEGEGQAGAAGPQEDMHHC
ncbi:60S ribosomal protein L7a-like [Peromyscus californicus insignis]|uniref:60S ribosomal protein L7a-like n=1 Tax=Peromyscus californicus insignis TaxID=564181 RepID=UPI0022A6CCEA|nr:60S ribosomal protein L7a-like [Peromyscus californicus insignis]